MECPNPFFLFSCCFLRHWRRKGKQCVLLLEMNSQGGYLASHTFLLLNQSSHFVFSQPDSWGNETVWNYIFTIAKKYWKSQEIVFGSFWANISADFCISRLKRTKFNFSFVLRLFFPFLFFFFPPSRPRARFLVSIKKGNRMLLKREGRERYKQRIFLFLSPYFFSFGLRVIAEEARASSRASPIINIGNTGFDK